MYKIIRPSLDTHMHARNCSMFKTRWMRVKTQKKRLTWKPIVTWWYQNSGSDTHKVKMVWMRFKNESIDVIFVLCHSANLCIYREKELVWAKCVLMLYMFSVQVTVWNRHGPIRYTMTGRIWSWKVTSVSFILANTKKVHRYVELIDLCFWLCSWLFYLKMGNLWGC